MCAANTEVVKVEGRVLDKLNFYLHDCCFKTGVRAVKLRVGRRVAGPRVPLDLFLEGVNQRHGCRLFLLSRALWERPFATASGRMDSGLCVDIICGGRSGSYPVDVDMNPDVKLRVCLH